MQDYKKFAKLVTQKTAENIGNLINSGKIIIRNNTFKLDEDAFTEAIERHCEKLHSEHGDLQIQLDKIVSYLTISVKDILLKFNESNKSNEELNKFICDKISNIPTRQEVESLITQHEEHDDKNTQKVLDEVKHRSQSIIENSDRNAEVIVQKVDDGNQKVVEEVNKFNKKIDKLSSTADKIESLLKNPQSPTSETEVLGCNGVSPRGDKTNKSPAADTIIVYAQKLQDYSFKVIIPENTTEIFYYMPEFPTIQIGSTVKKLPCPWFFKNKELILTKQKSICFDPRANLYRLYLKKNLHGKTQIEQSEQEEYIISEETIESEILCIKDCIPNSKGKTFYRAILFDPNECAGRHFQVYIYDASTHFLFRDKNQKPISFEDFKYLASKSNEKISVS